jgi:hypothetical protein
MIKPTQVKFSIRLFRNEHAWAISSVSSRLGQITSVLTHTADSVIGERYSIGTLPLDCTPELALAKLREVVTGENHHYLAGEVTASGDLYWIQWESNAA